MRPTDSAIRDILLQVSEENQRSFFLILRYIKRHKKENELSVYKKILQPVLIEKFADFEITENQVWLFSQILRKIYDLVPKKPIKPTSGILAVFDDTYNDLPTPQIVTGPDEKNYLKG